MSWQERRIGDLCTVGRGSSPRPINDQRFFENGDIPWIKVADATASGKYLLETKLCVNRHGASFSRLLPPGSLIICTSGTLGLPIILGVEGCIHDGWLYTYDYEGLDPEFFYYFLQTQRNYFASVAYGAAIQNINTEILRNTAIRLPMLDVQSRIASVLKSYDDLIENNRRRMALLEESARLLYGEWFVRLRFPGYEHSRIVDGMPDGWERKALSELTSFLKRGITPNYDDEAEGLVVNQKCIREGRVNLELARRQSKEVKPERLLRIGDVLVNSTGEGTLGRVAQVKILLAACTVDTHVTIVRPGDGVPRHYFGLAVMEWEPRFSTMGKGATNQTELSPKTIGDAVITVPSQTLLEQFELFAEPVYEQVTNLVAQNQKLRTARDLLLPRLMNGEIAI